MSVIAVLVSHLHNYNLRMRPVILFSYAVLTFIARPAAAQDVSHAYCGTDGKAHLVFRNGAALTLPIQEKQVGCDHVTVARDGHTIGWSVLVENCCTSYPIPIAVVVYHNGKKTVISPGQTVWEWRFTDEGKRIAVLSGPVHGNPSEAGLYDSHNGRTQARWDGKGAPPVWAIGWEQQFTNCE